MARVFQKGTIRDMFNRVVDGVLRKGTIRGWISHKVEGFFFVRESLGAGSVAG